MLLTKLDSEKRDSDGIFDPARTIERAAHMLEPLAEQAGVRILCEMPGDFSMRGDEDDFYAVVFNLMENAIKYNKNGGQVETRCFLEENRLLVTVSDSGVGMEEEELPKIYERFYRIDQARSREAGGAGLGLSIVRRTVERMGGTVSVKSEPGKGTCFTLTFPPEVLV